MARLIVIGGSLATGKSTIAKYLEEQLHVKRISMDELKERLFDIGGYRDRKWSMQIGQLAWPVFQKMIELHLDQGEDVIAEATFLWPDDGAWIEKSANQYATDIYQIWMTADPQIARERFIARAQSSQRHPGHNDALEHVLEEFDQRIFNRTFVPHPIKANTLIVDTTEFADGWKERICDFLKDVKNH